MFSSKPELKDFISFTIDSLLCYDCQPLVSPFLERYIDQADEYDANTKIHPLNEFEKYCLNLFNDINLVKILFSYYSDVFSVYDEILINLRTSLINTSKPFFLELRGMIRRCKIFEKDKYKIGQILHWLTNEFYLAPNTSESSISNINFIVDIKLFSTIRQEMESQEVHIGTSCIDIKNKIQRIIEISMLNKPLLEESVKQIEQHIEYCDDYIELRSKYSNFPFIENMRKQIGFFQKLKNLLIFCYTYFTSTLIDKTSEQAFSAELNRLHMYRTEDLKILKCFNYVTKHYKKFFDNVISSANEHATRSYYASQIQFDDILTKQEYNCIISQISEYINSITDGTVILLGYVDGIYVIKDSTTCRPLDSYGIIKKLVRDLFRVISMHSSNINLFTT